MAINKKKILMAVIPAMIAVAIVWAMPRLSGAYTDTTSFVSSASDKAEYYVNGTKYSISSIGVARYTPYVSGNWVEGSSGNIQLSAADLNELAKAIGMAESATSTTYVPADGTLESLSQKFESMVK